MGGEQGKGKKGQGSWVRRPFESGTRTRVLHEQRKEGSGGKEARGGKEAKGGRGLAVAPKRKRPSSPGGTSTAHPRVQPAHAPLFCTGTATLAHPVPRARERGRREGEAEDGGQEERRATARSRRALGASTAADTPAGSGKHVGATIRRERGGEEEEEAEDEGREGRRAAARSRRALGASTAADTTAG